MVGVVMRVTTGPELVCECRRDHNRVKGRELACEHGCDRKEEASEEEVPTQCRGRLSGMPPLMRLRASSARSAVV